VRKWPSRSLRNSPTSYLPRARCNQSSNSSKSQQSRQLRHSSTDPSPFWPPAPVTQLVTWTRNASEKSLRSDWSSLTSVFGNWYRFFDPSSQPAPDCKCMRPISWSGWGSLKEDIAPRLIRGCQRLPRAPSRTPSAETSAGFSHHQWGARDVDGVALFELSELRETP